MTTHRRGVDQTRVDPSILAHSVRGTGPRSVVLLHGFLGSGRNLGSLARSWSAADPSLTIVLPDLTGHGASPALPEGASLTTIAEDVLRLAEHLHLAAPLELVGHSLGGRVSLAARALAPERVTRVVLLDSSPSHPKEGGAELDLVLAALLDAPAEAESRTVHEDFLRARGLSTGLVAWLSMNLVVEAGHHRWRIDRDALARLLANTRTEDLWPVVEAPGGEIALVRGGRSTFVTDEDAARMQRAGRSVETIEGAGHFLHVDRPQAVLEALRRPTPSL